MITLTPGHAVKIEEKPEVKKAGGVYYTPTRIVNYIVENTLGKALDGKTFRQAERLRILDPACGSGSFLIVAYQYLLDWNRQQYIDAGEKRPKGRLYEDANGEWQLTTDTRRKILLNNIYGVDIDTQSVETTKLSLLLKVLERETSESLGSQLRLLQERALPDLGRNIQCGNSLIAPDYNLAHIQTNFLNEAEHYRVNVFDWDSAFHDVLTAGGFDVVIGNPPYVRPHNILSSDKEYFWRHYTTFVKKSDLYCCFIEKGLHLLKPAGTFGYIVSDGFLRLDSFENLREMLLSETAVRTIIDFTGYVFERANVKTAILLFSKVKPRNNTINVETVDAAADLGGVTYRTIAQSAFEKTYKHVFDLSMNDRHEAIKQKMLKTGQALGDIFDVAFGLKTGDDAKFISYEKHGPESRPLVRGEDVHRYSTVFKGEYVWYVPEKMTAHRRTARPGKAARFEQPKVLIRDTGDGLQGTFDGDNYYAKDVLIISTPTKDAEKLLCLTGIINSKLMRFYYETTFPTLHVQSGELASLPLPNLNGSDPASKSIVSQITSYVRQSLALQKRARSARTSHEKVVIQHQVESVESHIDHLVYQLYRLTADEIATVEEEIH